MRARELLRVLHTGGLVFSETPAPNLLGNATGAKLTFY